MLFAKGLREPETPRLLKDNSWLAVEMKIPGKIVWISSDGHTIKTIAEIERPNGVCIDYENNLWVAATHPEPSLLKVSMDGSVEVFLNGMADESFMFPNDLCFGPDGKLYMTDSGILFEEWEIDGQLRPDYMDAPFDGRVYQIDISEGSIKKIDSEIKFTNGIAFGPDGNLYVNEMITGDIFRYLIKPGGTVGKREYIGNVISKNSDEKGFKGPDGMAFGADGNIYCTVMGQKNVTVLTTSGKVLKRIVTNGKHPTNLGFGPDGEKKIYVTEKEFGTIEVHDVETHGAKIYKGV